MKKQVKVALAGRPNVGKSTLFNVLTTGARALVHDTPGVTRDTREQPGKLGELEFTLLDTAGVDSSRDDFDRQLADGSTTAWDQADIILFLIDGKYGILPADEELAQILRRSKKQVIPIINKADLNSAELIGEEARGFGFGTPLLISAEHSTGLEQLHTALSEFMPDDREPAEFEEELDDVLSRPIRVAVIGRPNAGKSTLVNKLLSEERMMTGPVAGLTRESISHSITVDEQEYELLDTPGVRKKNKVVDDLEKLSVQSGLNAIEHADVLLLLLDGTTFTTQRRDTGPLEQQDARLGKMVLEAGKPLIVLVNKWDLVEEKEACLGQIEYQLEKELAQVRYLPYLTISAATGKKVDSIWPVIKAQAQRWAAQLSTADVNRWLEEATAKNPPPQAKGKVIKLKFAKQVSTQPPAIAVFGNRVSMIPPSYERYLVNRLQEAFDLPGIPICMFWRGSDNPFHAKTSD